MAVKNRTRSVDLTRFTSVCYFPKRRWWSAGFLRARGYGWRLYIGKICVMRYRTAGE